MKFLNYFTSKKSRFSYTQRPKGRIVPSIDDFIKAVESATNPTLQNRLLLYSHYETTMLYDTYVSALIEKRLENITSKNIVLFDGDKRVETSLFDSPKFEKFTKDVILNKFWGMTLFEFNRGYFDYYKIPIKHINPFRREVLVTPYDETGTSFDNNNCLFIGDDEDLGLLLKITLLSLYKRLGMFNYGRYVDLASENFTQLKVRGLTEELGLDTIESYQNRAGGGTMQLPEGAELSQENQSSSQQNQLFENYMSMLKEELAVLILGQTMTTQNGSSRSQAEVHQIEQETKYSSDEKYLLDVLNYDFIEYVGLWGIPYSDSMRFELVETSETQLNRKLNNYKILKDLGLQFTDEELRRQFDLLI